MEGIVGGFPEEGGLVDLGEVVVFGGEPEDGDMRDTGGAGGFGGAGDRGCGFQQSKQWAAEEANLLAGDDGAGSVAEEIDVAENGGGSLKRAALGFESVREGGGICGRVCGRVKPLPASGNRAVPASDGSIGRGCLLVEKVLVQAGGMQERDGVALGAGFRGHASLLER